MQLEHEADDGGARTTGQGPRVLVLSGALDVRCTAELRDALYALIDDPDASEVTVVLDLTEVESVDMTALKVIAVAHRAAERRGGRVVLRGASIGVRRLRHLTHLRAMLPVEAAPPRRSAV